MSQYSGPLVLQRVGAGGPLPPTRLRILDLCQRACRRSARPGERGGSGTQSAVRRQPVAPRAAACLARRTEDWIGAEGATAHDGIDESASAALLESLLLK